MSDEKRGRGRPRLPPELHRVTYCVRISPELRQFFRDSAQSSSTLIEESVRSSERFRIWSQTHLSKRTT